MNASVQATLTKVPQNVSSAVPTVHARPNVLQPATRFHTFSVQFLNSSSRANATVVGVGDDQNDSSTWLSIRLVVVACLLIGIVLMTLGSYSIHRKWCTKDSQRHKYHKTTLIL